ncbi:MAG: cysteine desulfurase [Anaerolineae bacterium]|nr:cysteine desulfurase [Anaerolineae bacterium]MDW8071136.1 cysteine desulfurase family protein [Anaerolineae bacterium]
MRRVIYLDHSASTPVDARVLEVMMPFFTEYYGNPSGMHAQARASAQALDRSRWEVAEILGCKPKEIIFTSCGTESNNLAIRGVAFAAARAGKGRHIITSACEHSAVTQTIAQLCEHFGFQQTVVPVDRWGMIDPADVERALRPDTVLISIIYANNEVGTIQPLAEIGAIARAHGIPLHTDAVQAGGYLDLNVDRLNVDLLSLSGHKFYAPKGVGMLFVREGVALLPQQTGGGHERGRRAGTENVPYIVALAKALKLAHDMRPTENERLARLRDHLIQGVQTALPDAQLTGHPTERLPHHASFVIPGVEANALLMYLDMAGICAASGSACHTGIAEPSAVLLAMGIPRQLALGALRLTLGRSNTAEDIEMVLEVLPAAVRQLSAL